MRRPSAAVRCDQGLADDLNGNTETCAPESIRYSTFQCVSGTCSRLDEPTAEINCGGRWLCRFPSMHTGRGIWWSESQNLHGTSRGCPRRSCPAAVMATLLSAVCVLVSVDVQAHVEVDIRQVVGYRKVALQRLLVLDARASTRKSTKLCQLSRLAAEGRCRCRR